MSARSRAAAIARAVRLPVGYGLLALLSFPTLESIVYGEHGLNHDLDVFDLAGGVPRIGATVTEWTRYGFSWWDPYFGTGNDILAQHSIAPFAPDVLLGFVIGMFAAYVVNGWLMAAVAGLGMHLFLRDVLRVPPAARVIGSVVFLFGFWHEIYGFSALGVPIAIWLAELALRPGPNRWRAIVGLVAFDGFVLYAGQSQVALLVGAVQLAWLLIAGDHGRVRDRIGVWAGSWLASLALSGPILLAQLAYLPVSERAAWNLADIYDARLGAVLHDTASFYSSLLFGLPVATGIGGSPDRYGTYFVGIAGLVLAAIAIVAAFRRPVDRRLLALVLLLVAIPILDMAAVLVTPLQQQLGFLRSFQFVRIRHVMPFVVAALVAAGAGRVVGWLTAESGAGGGRDGIGGQLRRATERLRRPSASTIGVVLVAAVLAVAIIVQVIVGASAVLRLRGHLLDPTVPELGRVLIVGSFGIGIVAVVVVAAWLLRGRHLGPLLVLVVVALVAGDRLLYAHGERFISPSLGTYADEVALTPAQTFVMAQGPPELNRVLSVGLAGDRMGAYGIFQADGYQAIYPLGVHDLFGVLTDPWLRANPALYRYFHGWGVRAYAFGPAVDHEVADLEGIRWLIVRGGADPGPGWTVAFRNGEDVVYANPTALPRAFVATAIAPAATQGEVIAGLGAATRDQLAATAFIEAGDRTPLPSSIPIAASGASRSASIASYAPDRQVLDVADGPAGILVLTDATGPGWTATLDGSPAPVVSVDLAFRGVAIGAGTHTVVLAYRPTATFLGLLVAVVAALATIGWGWAIRRRDRRRQPVERPA